MAEKITPEMLDEARARALNRRIGLTGVEWDKLNEAVREYYRSFARAIRAGAIGGER